MGARGQGNDTNSVGVYSSVGGARSALEVQGSRVYAGQCASAIGVMVIHWIAL